MNINSEWTVETDKCRLLFLRAIYNVYSMYVHYTVYTYYATRRK